MSKIRDLLYGENYNAYEQIQGLASGGNVLLPFDGQGWCSNSPVFDKYIQKIRPALIIEVGSWQGASAIHMAEYACRENIDVEIVCVDTWLGSVEHWHNSTLLRDRMHHGRPNLFPQFMCNIIHKNLQKHITPFPCDSINAAHTLSRYGVQADLIYIDAGHEYDSVSMDIKLYKPLLREGGVMILDDAHYAPIRQAADEQLPGYTTEGAKLVWTR